MKITAVSASVRFSKALGDASHKTIGLSVEASLDAEDAWRQAQSQLYADLGQPLIGIAKATAPERERLAP